MPSGPRLGGATANFAYYVSLLGENGLIASRIGDDRLGQQAKAQISANGLSTDAIQQDNIYPTGTVNVLIKPGGEPNYMIEDDVAWAHMCWTPEWQAIATRTDAICFGTVARHKTNSATAIDAFLDALNPSALCLCDVNLRESRYNVTLLKDSFHRAHVVKLNDGELNMVSELLNLGGRDLEFKARQLLVKYNLHMVCVTRGAEGSLLITATDTVTHPGVKVEVEDTIGAGDSFTAILACGYLNQVPLKHISEAANQLGAWVASAKGATPEVDEEVITVIRGILWDDYSGDK